MTTDDTTDPTWLTDAIEAGGDDVTFTLIGMGLGTPPLDIAQQIARAAILASDWLAAREATIRADEREQAAARVESLDDFYRLPVGTIVHKTWPYQGSNAEPEVWLRPNAAATWVEISDPSGWEDRCAVDVAYHDDAIHRVVYLPARVVRGGGGDE